MINDILELKQNLNEKRLEYCSKHLKSNQKIIYFAHSLLEREYVGSTFNVWYALNNHSDNLKVIIGNIGPASEDINKEEIIIYEKYQSGLNSVLPKNLDFLVLPFVNYDLTDLVIKIRKQNPGIKIIYQIDFDFTTVSKQNKDLKSYEDNQEIIFENIRVVDKIIYKNKTLFNYFYDNKKKFKIEGIGTDGTANVSFINLDVLETISNSKEDKTKEAPKRIGVLCTKENGPDLLHFKKVWDAVNKKYKDKISWQLYGFKNKEITKAFSNVKTEFTQETGINSYYNELFNLNLDCMVIPTKNEMWNINNYDLNRVVELQALGIPLVVSDIKPINEFIKDEKNGFLCEDRDRMIRQLNVICELDNSKDSDNILKKVSKVAFKHINQSYDITIDNNIAEIENIFLKDS